MQNPIRRVLAVTLTVAMLFVSPTTNMDHDTATISNEVETLIASNKKLKTEVETITQFLMGTGRLELTTADQYARLVTRYSRANGLPSGLIAGIIMQESYGDSAAISHRGAIGLMQIMPEYWKGVYPECGDNLLAPETNVCYGTKIFRHFLNKHDGSVKRALSAYNGANNWAYANRVLMWTGTFCAGSDL